MTQQQDGLSAMIEMLNANGYLVSLTQDALDRALCAIYLQDSVFVTCEYGKTFLEALSLAAKGVLQK